MSTYSSSDFRSGLKVLIDGQPYTILESEFNKPGKGQAFNKLKLKNLKNGKVLEKTVKIGVSLEQADVVLRDMQYLYNDGNQWYFMDMESYEQFPASLEAVQNLKQWLKEEAICIATLWNNELITLEPPNFIEVKVIKTDPGLRGDTTQGAFKPAQIETGAKLRVPLFINQDEYIKVDTRTGEYVSRVKR
jgi:elongation factor P|tara:strand:- start:13 stop:582 length:570 start_codon:yes stop_codon:yes gene_type:complete